VRNKKGEEAIEVKGMLRKTGEGGGRVTSTEKGLRQQVDQPLHHLNKVKVGMVIEEQGTNVNVGEN